MMNRKRLVRVALAFVLLAATWLLTSPADAAGGSHPDRGTIVVANRASGDLSLIDVATDTATTLAMPAGENVPEPMYVVSARRRVFVGDRANNRVVAFDRRTWAVLGEAPTGAGVFHMWADPTGRQLWVNNDIDNTITVVDTRRLDVLATIDLPADLVADGGKPHDVILDGRSAYVTLVGLSGDQDAVVRYSQRSFREKARAAVGKDPHVTLDPWRGRLYVASQNADEIAVLRRNSLQRVDTIDVPAAHGLDITRNGRVVYTTNIAGGGNDAIWTIDARRNEVIGEPVDAPFPTPHNLVLTNRNDKLYLTHSGATSNKVSVYEVSRRHPEPVLLTTVDVGLNPFGLDFAR